MRGLDNEDGDEQRDDHESGGAKEGCLVARNHGASSCGAAGKVLCGSRGSDDCQDGKSEGTPDLLGCIDETRHKTGFATVNARSSGDGG